MAATAAASPDRELETDARVTSAVIDWAAGSVAEDLTHHSKTPDRSGDPPRSSEFLYLLSKADGAVKMQKSLQDL
jgi:hypothetical protein